MTRAKETAIELLSRFRLGDIAILVSLVVFLVSSRPDTQARADIQLVKKDVQTNKENIEKKEDKAVSEAQYQEVIHRLERMENKIDQIKR